MATIQYARLYPDTTQLQAKDGHNLTAGWVEVYLAGTDDPAITYADFNGTVNPQRIVVDDNGRFTAIVDKSKAYRVEVYDSEGMLQWTTEPVWCTGNAGAGISVTRVISTDGSIDVEEQIDGSERTYDLSIAPPDNDEYLEWIKCSEEDCGSTWRPVYQAGTMETEAGQGIKVHGGHLYHFTSTFYLDPNGTGINYDTFKATMYCNDEIVDVRDFDIDSSLNDSVMCEFSTDLIPEEDGVVYYKLTIPSTCEVTAEVQCHRIYSGINAVPDSCAAKPWVSEYFEEKSSMSAYIPYSGLEYNQGGDITGISGSAIYAALDSGTVSAIASSYAESAFSSISGWSGDFSSISSKIDWSSSGVFQPSGDYQTAGDYAYNSSLSSKVDQSAFDQCCNDVHSALDEKLDKSASSEFQPSGDYVYGSSYSSFSSEVTNNISSLSSTVSGISADMSAYVPFSGLEYNDNGDISGISGSSIAGGLDSAAVSSIASSYAESAISSISRWSGDFSSISSKIDWSSSGVFQPSGDYAYNSSLSSKVDQSAFEQCCDEVHSSLDDKLDKSASSEFQPSGEYVYESAYSSFSSEVTNNITSISSTVSGLTGQYIEQSASSMFQPSGNYASASDLSSYVPFSGLEGEGGRITGISGSSIKGHEYTGINPVTVDNTADTISVEHRTLCVDSTMTAYNSGSSAVIGVNVAGLDISSKMDASASALFYPMDNPSGYITGVDLTPYQLTADMSAYAHESSLSAKLDASASSDFYETANPSGFIDGVSASAIASAYQVVSATATQLNAGTAYLTSVNETQISAARAGNAANASLATSAWYDGTGRMISALPDEATVSAIASAYAESAASSKQDTLSFGYDDYDKISAINGSALAGQGGGGLVTAIGTSTSGITSINKSGLVDTAALRSADYSSLYVQEPLYISASGDSSYIGISGDVGGVDSATCSAIASAYAESAVSAVSGDYYSTSNPSGFITSAPFDSATCSAIASSYAESAVSSVSGNYYTTANESGYALSADVSGTVDLVSSQSANWGGSALALSAGPGVKLEKSGNVLVASTDETVLWSGACLTQGGAAATLSEAASNFDKIEVYAIPNPSNSFAYPQCFTYPGNNTAGAYLCPFMTTALKGKFCYGRWTITNGTAFDVTDAGQTDSYPAINYDNSYGGVVKVVGINRTAEA